MKTPPRSARTEDRRLGDKVLKTDEWCIALTTENESDDDDPTPPPIRGRPHARGGKRRGP